MNFKYISKFFLISLLFLIPSCKSIDFLNENIEDLKSLDHKDIQETETLISLNLPSNSNHTNIDFYNNIELFSWNNKIDYKKLISFNSYKKNYEDSNSLIGLISENFLYFLNNKSELISYDLPNFEFSKTIKLNLPTIEKNIFPTSVASKDNVFFASYINGKLIKFKSNGEILWLKDFKDIIKTPIKLFNDNIIVMLTDSIASVNSTNGSINWQFFINSKNSLSTMGGNLVDLNHFLFFVLPNNQFGKIDTIFGELKDFPNPLFNNNNSIKSNESKLHSYNNILSYFDGNQFLSTFNIATNKFYLESIEIENTLSFIYFNNSLITTHNDGFLKSFNILNGNIFWKVNLLDLIDQKDKIIEVANYKKSLIIFFKSGKIIELNSINGNLISYIKINSKNIIKIQYIKNYIIATQQNGKTSIYTK